MPTNDLTIIGRVALFHRGWLSQWHPSAFTVDGVPYNCAEQYMMAEKARLFGDHRQRDLILAARTPAEQKHLGRQVRGFEDDVWRKFARPIVYFGNRAKFIARRDLREKLEGTGDLVLAEASATDQIWGIGLRPEHPHAGLPSRWNGTNWLGQVLMRVRVELQLDTRMASLPPPTP